MGDPGAPCSTLLPVPSLTRPSYRRSNPRTQHRPPPEGCAGARAANPTALPSAPPLSAGPALRQSAPPASPALSWMGFGEDAGFWRQSCPGASERAVLLEAWDRTDGGVRPRLFPNSQRRAAGHTCHRVGVTLAPAARGRGWGSRGKGRGAASRGAAHTLKAWPGLAAECS